MAAAADRLLEMPLLERPLDATLADEKDEDEDDDDDEVVVVVVVVVVVAAAEAEEASDDKWLMLPTAALTNANCWLASVRLLTSDSASLRYSRSKSSRSGM